LDSSAAGLADPLPDACFSSPEFIGRAVFHRHVTVDTFSQNPDPGLSRSRADQNPPKGKPSAHNEKVFPLGEPEEKVFKGCTVFFRATSKNLRGSNGCLF